MPLRDSYARFDAWLREHTAAEFLAYFLAAGLTTTGLHFFLSNRQLPYSIVLGVAVGLAFATVLTFVDDVP